LAENNVSSNAAHGIHLAGAAGNTLSANNAFGNTTAGIYLEGSSGNDIKLNHAYSNSDVGVHLFNGSYFNVVEGNYAYAQPSHGFWLQSGCDHNTLASNNAYVFGDTGILLDASASNTLAFNESYSGTRGVHLRQSSDDNLLASNEAGSNTAAGISLDDSSNGTLIDNLSHDNGSYGLLIKTGASGSTLVGGGLGYDSAGAADPNTQSELHIDDVSSGSLTLKGVRINPAVGISTDGFNREGNYLLSYNQDFDTGTVRLWGDLTLSGDTLTLDYATQLYAATATASKLMRGTGHSASVSSTNDTTAVSQIITIEHRGGQWHVDGSSSGADMASFTGSQANLTVPASDTQFILDFTEGGSAVEGDRVDFALIAASQDQNARKRLLFGPAADGFHEGRSKLAVAADAGVVLQGAETIHTLVDMLPGGTYYTFVDSGAFTAMFSSFTNMDPGGIQLSGSAGVFISSSVFDYLGFAAGTNAYITARDLASDIWLDNVGFLLSRSSHGFDSMYNVRVEGTDSSLRWRLKTGGTPLWGEDFDYDPNAKVAWINCSAIASVQSGDWSDNLTWDQAFEPTECNATTVSAGHTVTVDRTDAIAAMTTVRGTLSFSRVAHSSLTIVGGDVTVEPGGHLDLGTEASPIPAGVRAHLVLALGQTAGQYGLIVQDGGDFTVRGATKTPYSTLDPSDSLLTDENTLTLSEDPAQLGWAVGDVITIGPSQGSGPGSTEKRTIAGIAGSIITVDVSFSKIHYGTATIDIADLTRNVLVRSSGTDTGSDTAYIRNLATNATSFNLSYGEFAYLGNNAALKYGIAFGGGARGQVSSSTVRNGYTGIYMFQSDGNTLASNTLYSNTYAGIHLDDTCTGITLTKNNSHSNANGLLVTNRSSGNTLSANNVYSNSTDGIKLSDAFDNTLSGNRSHSNEPNGILVIFSSSNTLNGNDIYANLGFGIYLAEDANRNTLEANHSYANLNSGVYLNAASHNTLIGNDIHSNIGAGLYITDHGDENLVVGNDLYSNSSDGMYLDVALDNTLIANDSYDNASYGVYVYDARGNTLIAGSLGYDASGAALPDAMGEIYLDMTPSEDLVLKGVRVNPAAGISTGGFNKAGNRLISYNQNFDTGTLRMWGDYLVSGSTLTLDYSTRLYASTATAPKLMRGIGHSAALVTTEDATAVSQLIAIEYRGGQWHVDGSVSGADMRTFTGSPAGLAVPSSTPQFTLDFTAGGSPLEGDRVDFALIASSRDEDVQKRLLFGPSASTFRGGKSKLSVASDGGIVLRGIEGTPTLMDRLDASSTYYTLVDSGAFTAEHSSMTNMDPDGLQLSGSGGVLIATSTFDFMGVAPGTNAYITARDLSSAATFYGLAFGVSRSTGGAYSAYCVRVEGVDSGLAWIMRKWSGPLGGEDYDQDAGGKVAWSPFAPQAGTPAIAAVYSSSVTLQWGDSLNDPGALYNLEASTASDFTGAVLSSATPNLTDTVSGLAPNATYYLRVSAVDIATSPYTSLGSTVTLSPAPTPLADSFTEVSMTSVTVAWTALPAGSAESYVLEASSTDFDGTGVLHSSSTPDIPLSTLVLGLGTAMEPNTTYYFRVAGVNRNGVASYSLLGATSTLAGRPGTVAPAFTEVFNSSVTVQWAPLPASPFTATAEGYILEASSTDFGGLAPGGIVHSSRTPNVGIDVLTLEGLQPNTTHYFRVGSLNWNGSPNYTALGATATFADAPAAGSAVFYPVASTAFGVSWTAGGNPLVITTYTVEASTASDFNTGATDAVSLATAPAGGPHATFTGLSVNTTYYLRAQAVNHYGFVTAFVDLESTATLTVPPATAVTTFTAVASTSMTAVWERNGNPADVTTYTVVLSTSPAYPNAFSGTVSADTAPAGASPAATLAGLVPNTTYHLFIQAVNHNGVGGGFASLGSTATLASAPLSAAATFSEVTAGGFGVSWGSGGNPLAASTYTVQASTAADFNAGATDAVSLSTVPAAGPFATFTGLSVNTTYYVRVTAVNHNGVGTAYTELGSTSTLTNPPAAAASTYTAVSISSMSVAWGPGGNLVDVTTYTVVLSTGSGYPNAFSGNVSASTAPAGGSPAATLTGLAPNATYHLFVEAINHNGVGGGVIALGSTSTLANALLSAATTFSAVAADGFGVSWDASSNPLGLSSYTLQASTAADFNAGATDAVSLATAPAAGPFATLTALSANTTYYVRAQAFNHNGIPTAFAELGSTSTLAAAPATAVTTFTVVASTTMTVAWESGGNPVDVTTYTVVLSTGSGYPNAFSGNVSESTAPAGSSPTATLAGLEPNTTYQLFVEALNHNGLGSGVSALGSTATLANAPLSAAATFSAVTTSGFGVSWDGNANPMALTAYALEVSTAPDFDAGAADAVTLATAPAAGPFATVTGLGANATYYARVRAVNHNAVPTAYAQLGSTWTVVAAPVSADPTGISTSTITPQWGAGGNSPVTRYTVEISTDDFATVNASSVTVATSAVFSGLLPDTTYYFRVLAAGNDGRLTAYTPLPSAITYQALPESLEAAFAAVETSSISVNWTGGAPGATYEAEISTDGFASVNLSSSTLNLSALFGAGGAGDDLAPNTTYHFRVRTVGAGGPGPFVNLGSTVTLASIPGAISITTVASTTVGVDWLPNGNPEPGTQYELWRDTEAAFGQPLKTLVAASAHLAEGLSKETTYYFKARARNHTGLFSAFNAAVSTWTLIAPPGQPGTPAGATLGVSSIAWTWAAAVDVTIGYRVFSASSPESLAGSSAGTTFYHTGLATNTAYGIVVGGVNAGGVGPLSAAATVYTLAVPPAGTAASAVEATSATLTWSLNTNPAATVAELERSTDNAVFAGVFTGGETSYTDYGLLGCTTYYYRARNRNGDGVPTGYDAAVQIMTEGSTPIAPSGLSAASLAGGRIALFWNMSPSELVTEYRIYYDSGTGTVDYATPLATVSSTVTAYTTDVLVSSPAYTFSLRAYNRCGVEEPNTIVVAAAASEVVLQELRAAVKVPASGQRVKGNRVTVKAELTLGDPGQTKQVLFEYKASTGSSWTAIAAADPNHPNPDPAYPYFVHWDADSLAATSYDLRAVATDTSDNADAGPPSVTIAVVDTADFDISESLVAGKIVKSQVVNNGAPSSVEAGDADSPQLTTLAIPAGALDSSTLTVTMANNPATTPAASSDLDPAGVSVEITLSNGQSQLAGGRTATLTLAYPDADNDGVVDGTALRADDLDIYAYDAVAGEWAKGFASTVDLASRTIAGNTPHLSFFALFALKPSSPTAVRVYPVPFKPNSGSADDGVAYSPGDSDSGIIFDNLPDQATIEIYTVTGQRVARSAAGTAGRVQWDVKNESGRDVASGGYIALIKSPSQNNVVKKLLIIR
ncbi:MAG: fibronectin type III domain-containing protein, partial [Elusimicrobiota bacterium]